METSKDLFKDLEIAEKLFLDGSIKNAQKKVRDVLKELAINDLKIKEFSRIKIGE